MLQNLFALIYQQQKIVIISPDFPLFLKFGGLFGLISTPNQTQNWWAMPTLQFFRLRMLSAVRFFRIGQAQSQPLQPFPFFPSP
ncbi:MAG: hypothetical protein AAGC54_19150, partial [Cyanobacteria bacterium P01_F01_bin.4]